MNLFILLTISNKLNYIKIVYNNHLRQNPLYMMLFTLYNIHINIHIIHTEERFIDKKYYNLCQKVIWSIGHLKRNHDGTIYVSIHYDMYVHRTISMLA